MSTETPEIIDAELDPISVHTYFGLSYSSHLVLDRTLLQSMPIEWQHEFVAKLEQLDAAFAHLQRPQYQVSTGAWHYVSELDKHTRKQLGITSSVDNYSPEELEDDQIWDKAHDEEVLYDAQGNELDSVSRVFVPGPNPIEHYNRGRTHIEPRI